MQPDGAQKLADAAGQQARVLESFSSVLASGRQSSLFDNGSQMLASLVSGQNQNAITAAISEFTGLEEGASGSVLGILAPVVMGSIAQHQGKARLDANDIANYLASQKDNIIAALPSGFGRLLGGTNLLNSLNREEERLTEDEMARRKLGPRGVPNAPDTARLTSQAKKDQETKVAAERARLLIEQSETLGEPPEDPLLLFSVLYGFWAGQAPEHAAAVRLIPAVIYEGGHRSRDFGEGNATT
jgi:hypothetical protein